MSEIMSVWLHIPPPEDRYSPNNGSALSSIIYEISKVHESRGGKTQVISSKHIQQKYDCGEVIGVGVLHRPKPKQKLFDAACGLLGLPRFFALRQYAPVLEAIPADFDGVIFVHNNPVVLRPIKKLRPRAKVCLWANNELWRPYRPGAIKKIANASHALICCSEYIARDLRARIGDHPKIKVVRNGVNSQKFVPKSELRETPPVIAFIGRVLPHKGVHLLVEAAAKIQGERDFKLRIVGSRQFNPKEPLNAYQLELRDSAQKLGDKIEFIPAVDRHRVVEEYQKASIFCAPSVWNDPCPLTILEGMAMGIPTITTRRGGIAEIGGEAALYFDPENVDEFAELLADLIDHPQKRVELGEKSRIHAQNLSWEKRYDELLNALH